MVYWTEDSLLKRVQQPDLPSEQKGSKIPGFDAAGRVDIHRQILPSPIPIRIMVPITWSPPAALYQADTHGRQ
jgi:hypothetical protein